MYVLPERVKRLKHYCNHRKGYKTMEHTENQILAEGHACLDYIRDHADLEYIAVLMPKVRIWLDDAFERINPNHDKATSLVLIKADAITGITKEDLKTPELGAILVLKLKECDPTGNNPDEWGMRFIRANEEGRFTEATELVLR